MNLALSLLSALLLLGSFQRFPFPLLAPLALAPLLYAAARETSAFRRFLNGYAAGVVYWFGICYWIQFVLAFHGGLGDALGWAVFLLFCLIKALHLGLFTTLAGVAMRSPWAAPLAAALWVAIEATHGLLGFAWLALGNAGIDMSIPLRLAPITGVWGLSFAFALLSAALALALLGRPRRQLAWVLLAPGLFLLPKLPVSDPARSSAAVVQPNISESEQWTFDSARRMQQAQVTLSTFAVDSGARRPAEIIVWPEVPAPLYYEDDALFRQLVDGMASRLRVPALFGTVAYTPAHQPLNSAQLVSAAGEPVARYDKVNLVPFGEFVPWPFGFANKISTEIGDFHPGEKVVVPRIDGHAIGAFICYESVFPNYVRRFAAGGAEVLFNLSNDGYFGKTSARRQHLQIVRMRAVENRRWIVRSTNNGLTVSINPAGRIAASLPPDQKVAGRMPFSYLRELTPYTRWGDWFALLCAGVCGPWLIRAGLLARRRP